MLRGAFTVQVGTMQLDANSANSSNASRMIAGDTAAHGAASFINLNMDSRTYISGAAQTLSGFGTFEGNNITTVSGTTIAPGSVGNIGKLTISMNLTLTDGSNFTFILGAATATADTSTSSQLAVGGALNLPDATLNLNLVDSMPSGTRGSWTCSDD